MAGTIHFYTNPMSRGQIVRWMLEEVGVDYEAHILDYDTGMKAPDYLAINPMGKVPSIIYEGQIVTECAAICAWLADQYPESGLAPPVSQRADYYRWLFFAAGPLEAAVTNNAMGFVAEPGREKMLGYGTFDLVVATLEKAVGAHDFICGSNFTAADVYVGSQIDWGLQFGTLPKNAIFERYADRLRNRPTYIRAKQKDATLIAEMSPGNMPT